MSADCFPLSGAQRGIYEAQMLDPQSPYYVVGEVLEIGPGEISLDIVQRSLDLLQQENETLRIRLREEHIDQPTEPMLGANENQTGPMQYIHTEAEPAAIVDLRGSTDPYASACATVDALRIDFAESARHLLETPLCRYTILRLADDQTWVVQIYHHIIIDGYSAALLTRRLGVIYTCLAQGKNPRPSGAGSIAELVALDQDYSNSPQHAADRKFWAKELSSLAPSATRAAMNIATGTGAASSRTITTTVQLPEADFKMLCSVASESKASWVDFLIAIHAVLAHRLSSAESHSDQVVALPIMARITPLQLKTPSMAVNVLPLKVHIANSIAFHTLLKDVTEKLSELKEHQYLRGESLPSLAEEGNLGALLHGVGINVKVFQPRVSFDGVSAILRNIAGGPPEDLGLVATPSAEGGIDLAFETDPERVSAILARQRLATLIAMVRHIINNPQATVGELPLLSHSDRMRTLHRRDAPAVATADIDPISIDDGIDALCQRGDTVLISGQSITTTGAELHQKIATVAELLRASCAKDSLVALRIPKSQDAVVAILAALTAHIPFVYIDPAAPGQRQESILTDANISHELRNDNGWKLLASDTQPTRDLTVTGESALAADELAYVIYTSGSTGQPKGVQIPRRALEALFVSHCKDLYHRPPARIAHTASFAFDASLDQLLWMLAGHCVRLYDSEDLRDADQLVLTLEREGIAVFDGTPTLISALVAAGLLDIASLTFLVVGGEAMPQQLWDTIVAHPVITATNIYGPTEATVDALRAEVTPGRVVVGKPISGVRAYLVDSALDLVPDGEVGELVLAGPQLALGYLGRVEETAAAFIEDVTIDPQVGPERIYRTGDQMRWIPGRGYQFLGRIDEQLEINGQRIEVSEVAAALRRLPHVVDAAVYPDGRTHRLVAAVVSKSEIDEQLCQRQLAHMLPSVMVPYRIWRAVELPTNAAGKTDYAALARLEDLTERAADTAEHGVQKSSSAAETVGVADPKHEILKNCLREILNIPSGNLTLYRDLFSIGGDSISALRIATLARKRGLNIAPKDLLSGQSLVAVVDHAPLTDSAPPSSELTDNANEMHPSTAAATAPGRADHYADFGVVPISTVAKQQFLAADSLISFRQHAMYRTIALHLAEDAEVDPRQLAAVADHLMFRHPALRMLVSFSDLANSNGATCTYPEQIIPRTALIPGRKIVHSTVDPTQLVATLAPDAGIVWAIGHSEHRAVIAVHHCAIDALSWNILATEFADLYRGFDPADLPPIAGSVRAHFKQIEGAVDTREVRASGNGSRPRRREALIRHRTMPGTRELIATLAAEEKTSKQNVLLAAFHLAWSTLVQFDEQLYVLEGHGRDGRDSDQDLSRTIGWFTTETTIALPALESLHPNNPKLSAAVAAEALCLARAEHGEAPSVQHIHDRIVLNILDANAGEDFGVIESTERHLTEELTVNVFLGDTMIVVEYVASPRLISGSDSLSDYLERLHDRFAEALGYVYAAAATNSLRSIPEDFACVRQGTVDLSAADLAVLEHKHGRIAELAPASPLQLGLFYHAAASSGADRYTVAMTVDIPGIGVSDSAAVYDSLHEVFQHHRGLGACFDAEVLPQVLFVVPAHPQFRWAVHDFSHLDPQVAALAIAELKQRRTDRKINLEQAPIVSADLIFTVARDSNCVEAKLLLGNHHILTDGWSTQVFLADLMTVIERRCSHREGSSLRSHTPFSEYLNYLTQLDQTIPSQQWKRRLADITPAVRPCIVTEASANIDSDAAAEGDDRLAEVFEDDHGNLAALAQRYGFTPAIIVQACWAVTLASLLSRDQVIFGTTFSGRPVDLPATSDTVGLFINTLPIVEKIRASDSFASIAASIAQQCAQISEHDYFPLTEVEKIAGQAPLFDTAVIYENFRANSAAGSSSSVQMSGATHYPLTVVCPPADNIVVKLASRLSLVDEEIADAAANMLREILRTLADRKEMSLSVTELISDSLRQITPPRLVSYQEVTEGSQSSRPALQVQQPEDDCSGTAESEPSVAADAIAAAMSELLGGADIGSHDNFFSLGGDSMMAMRLMGRLRRRGLKLNIQQIIQLATPAALAEVAEPAAAQAAKRSQEHSKDNVVSIKSGAGTPLWCIHPINGMSLAFAPLGNDRRIDGPILALELPAAITAEQSPTPTLRALAAGYAKTIIRRQPTGPYRIIGYSFGGAVAETIADILVRRGQEVSFLGILDAYPAAMAPQVPDTAALISRRMSSAPECVSPYGANVETCLKIAATAEPTNVTIRTHIIVATRANDTEPTVYQQWDPGQAWHDKLPPDAALVSTMDSTHEGLVSPSSWHEITRRWGDAINSARSLRNHHSQ